MRRRKVLETIAGAGLLTAASYRRVLGANDRVRVGFVGIGLIGKRHLLDFLAQPDVSVAGIAEVSDARLAEGVETAGGTPERHKDFRRMLDRKDVDAVVVSTPDHWHALITILACAAGKDVYVEKPLNHAVREGEWMLRAQRQNRRVVQVGTQQRSGEQYRKCVELLRGGRIGDLRNVRIAAARNIMPGFSKPVAPEPLAPADWDMWLGPAPFVPYDANRCLYHFRWFWDYSGGQTTNLLSHDLDVVQWATGAVPRRVVAMGGRYSLTGIGETSDLVEALLDYPGFILNWTSHEASAGLKGGLEFFGTKGSMRVSRASLEVFPDRVIAAEDQIPSFTSPRRPPEDPPRWRTEPLKLDGYEQVRDQFVPHVRDFLDCVKSRRSPVSDLESAHQTATSCHLVNIALKLGRGVTWDKEKQDVVQDAEGSRLLTKEYRAPWDRELRAALPRPDVRIRLRKTALPDPTRRRLLRALPAAAIAAAWPWEPGFTAGKGRLAIAYTSFAVRMRQGRDLIRGTEPGAPSFPADTFVDLCRSFGADGCQMDVSQLASTDGAYLDGVKRRIGEAGLFLELSVDGKTLEDQGRFDDVAALARKLGAVRLRVALLHGRRYEDFPRKEQWLEFAGHWQRALPKTKPWLERHRLPVGIENHKDFLADELVALLRSVDSPWMGACIDFGNNLALLEPPLEVVEKLAPFAVTTHLKDMAVRPFERGFELSEVPLGTGMLPLARMVEVLRKHRPEAPLCLEMITRDPLKVPYLDDVYWATYTRRDEARIEAFRAAVLAKAWTGPLPRITGLALEEMIKAEDDNIRRSAAFARERLGA